MALKRVDEPLTASLRRFHLRLNFAAFEEGNLAVELLVFFVEVFAGDLKAELLEIRSTQVTSVVSRQIYRSEAEVLRGEDIGSSDRGAIGKQFVWS